MNCEPFFFTFSRWKWQKMCSLSTALPQSLLWCAYQCNAPRLYESGLNKYAADKFSLNVVNWLSYIFGSVARVNSPQSRCVCGKFIEEIWHLFGNKDDFPFVSLPVWFCSFWDRRYWLFCTQQVSLSRIHICIECLLLLLIGVDNFFSLSFKLSG